MAWSIHDHPRMQFGQSEFNRAGMTVPERRVAQRVVFWPPGGRCVHQGGGAATLSMVAAAVLLSGCGAMLPRSHAENPSPFGNYEEAREALERVVPYHTSSAELKALGFDIQASANVELLPYPQWLSALVHPNLPLHTVDPGIRDCIAAEQECRAYIFRYGEVDTRREGAFLADFLNFRRKTRTRGWRFQAAVLVRGDIILFRNHAGQPRIEQLELRRNPLGPLQNVGETSATGALGL